MNNIFSAIVQDKIPCYFVSPHLDDAALSCGAVISYLKDKTKVTVISVCTEISPLPYTLSAKTFLRQCGFESAKRLFELRRQEDREVFQSIGVETRHLGLTDASWRKKEHLNFFERMFGRLLPEFLHVYPTYRWHIISGRVSALDEETVSLLKRVLKKEIDNTKKVCVFCPMAIGGHVDHVLTRDCVTELFDECVVWSDFPYNSTSKEFFLRGVETGEKYTFSSHKEQKEQLIRRYATQYEAMFGKEGLTLYDEEYHVVRRK